MKPFDEHGRFNSTAEGDGLRRLAVRGAGVTVLSQGLQFTIQMLATIVLARLLGPLDFGLLAMVTTFSLLLMNFGVNGFTEAVLQREDMSDALASSLFWLNAGAGLVLTLAFAAAAPWLAWFYGDPRVAGVTVAIAASIFFTSASVLHLAFLVRAMRFSEVSATGVVARAVSVTVSIVLAVMGYGYWALVWGAVALPVVTCAGAWFVCRWVPGPPRRGVGTGAMVRFALHTYGRFTTGYFTRNLHNFLIGWWFGPAPLGFYKKAYDLFLLPNELSAPVTGVAVSALSRAAGNPEQYRRQFLGIVATLAFVGMGLAAALTLVGHDVIVLLLGPKWTASGRIFTFLGPGVGVMLLYLTHGWLHLSLGRADRAFRWGLIDCAVTTALLLLALPWGPIGIAVAWVVSLWSLTIPSLAYAGRPVALGMASIVGAVWKYAVAAALSGAGSAVILGAHPALGEAPGVGGAVGRIVVTSAVLGGLYLGLVVLLHGGTDPIRRVTRLAGDMAARRPKRAFAVGERTAA